MLAARITYESQAQLLGSDAVRNGKHATLASRLYAGHKLTLTFGCPHACRANASKHTARTSRRAIMARTNTMRPSPECQPGQSVPTESHPARWAQF